jgi:hypothetical protein
MLTDPSISNSKDLVSSYPILCSMEDSIADPQEEGLTNNILKSCLQWSSYLRRVKFEELSLRISFQLHSYSHTHTPFTNIGVPAPLTVEIIIDIQVPMNRTPPNTKGCSGSLEQYFNISL